MIPRVPFSLAVIRCVARFFGRRTVFRIFPVICSCTAARRIVPRSPLAPPPAGSSPAAFLSCRHLTSVLQTLRRPCRNSPRRFSSRRYLTAVSQALRRPTGSPPAASLSPRHLITVSQAPFPRAAAARKSTFNKKFIVSPLDLESTPGCIVKIPRENTGSGRYAAATRRAR